MNVDDSFFTRMLAHFERRERSAVDTLAAETEPLMNFLRDRVKENVPKDTGYLEDSVTVEKEKTATGVEYMLKADTNYALLVHERAPVEGREDPDGSTQEGGRGRKYFTRVIDAHIVEIRKTNERTAQKMVEGGDNRTTRGSL